VGLYRLKIAAISAPKRSHVAWSQSISLAASASKASVPIGTVTRPSTVK